MKKTILLLACALVLTFSAVSVNAYDSPTLTDTESITTEDFDSDSNTDSTKGGTDSLTDTDSDGKLTDNESDTKHSDSDSDSTKKDTDSTTTTTDTDKKTSPKTGTSVSYAVLSATAAAMFGCAAVTIKRKIKNK
ncbi:MAG: hypothetical protein II388_12270 [Clostridia bacterium]|nr:hypothetical protein [Clostridia bacterium]